MAQTAYPAGPRAVLRSTAPQLFVTDMTRSCGFFTQKLGFAVVFLYGEPPFYGQVSRDDIRLNLRRFDAPLIDPELRAREDYLSASIRVDNVQRLYAEFLATGAPIHQHLKNEPWGATTFIIRDPDGNLLLFL